MGAVAEADRGRRARDFLLRDDMLDIAEPEPALFLLDGDSVKPELAHLRPQMARGIRPSRRSRRRSARSCRRRNAGSSRGSCRPFHRGRNRVRQRTCVRSPVRRALAEGGAFEQGSADCLCALQHSDSGANHGHHPVRPDRHPVLRAHADGQLPGRAVAASARPSLARPRSRPRSSARVSRARTSTRCSWATCSPPASARPRRARRRSARACRARPKR